MLTEIQKLVLSKVKADRDAVASGTHPVDFTVRFHGTMTVGEDYERAATGNIPWLEATALWAEVSREAFDSLIEHAKGGQPVTVADLEAMRDSRVLATEILTDCIRTAMLDGESAVGKIAARVEGMEEAIGDIKRKVVASLPPQTAKGVVKSAVAVEVVGTPRNIAAMVEPTV
jgi:hypothetical protein